MDLSATADSAGESSGARASGEFKFDSARDRDSEAAAPTLRVTFRSRTRTCGQLVTRTPSLRLRLVKLEVSQTPSLFKLEIMISFISTHWHSKARGRRPAFKLARRPLQRPHGRTGS